MSNIPKTALIVNVRNVKKSIAVTNSACYNQAYYVVSIVGLNMNKADFLLEEDFKVCIAPKISLRIYYG